jgi:2-polyprenyl-3-methyl-5-hydroxy-6-metoxy-1,4-benzoquinol methylase
MNALAEYDDRLDRRHLAEIARDIFLQSALQTTIIRGATLELFLTRLRSALLRLADADSLDPGDVDDDVVSLFCALAQQCFLNEYVYGQSDHEIEGASRLRGRLLQNLSAGRHISPLLLAAVGAYFPLHQLPSAKSLLASEWPAYAADLLRLQVSEPLEEAKDALAIPALTAIEDQTSLRVMQQYEESPYPRWVFNPLAAVREKIGAGADPDARHQEILIAGCGTGEHPFDVAQKSPSARILAVDLSRASLAYARRKSREEGLRNVDYAQADILQLGTVGRSFDRIEAVGVLHHLADPKAGWRVLVSLLRPNGVMRVGLYSEIARRPLAEAQSMIAKQGYRPTASDIRAMRQRIIHERDDRRWDLLLSTVDFYSMSGCRDILFNVMEHRFTLPQIAACLDELGLSFLGFELDQKITEKFRDQYSDAAAMLDLDCWHTFEVANPQTFSNMYMFSVGKGGANQPARVTRTA